MASVSATCVKFQLSLKNPINLYQLTSRPSSLKLFSAGLTEKFPCSEDLKLPCFLCSKAKPETVQKVCEIVRKQLALPAETELTPEFKFSALGADSLDTVEIVMGLEEEFGINVEEENSQNITTVQEAADLIEKLVEKNSKA